MKTLAVLFSCFALLAAEASAQWFVLRKPVLYAEPNCFEFMLVTLQRPPASQMVVLDPQGNFRLTDYAMRQNWRFDPNAPGPFANWEAGDYVMTVLSRYGGDWYGCLGPRTMDLPDWARPQPPGPPPAPLAFFDGYCLLRNPDRYQPNPDGLPVCFEFYLADTRRSDAGRMAVIDNAGCRVTDYAARQEWEVDPFFGGPYAVEEQRQASAQMSALSRYGGDFYGCLQAEPPPQPPDGVLRGWAGSWQMISQWQTHSHGSFRTVLEVQITPEGISVWHGGNTISNVRISGNTLSYRADAGDHFSDITLTRTGDQLTGSFSGTMKASGEPTRGTYTGYQL